MASLDPSEPPVQTSNASMSTADTPSGFEDFVFGLGGIVVLGVLLALLACGLCNWLLYRRQKEEMVCYFLRFCVYLGACIA